MEIDDHLETARTITLQGKVSYQDCLRGVASVGGNLYAMSPTIEVSQTNPTMIGNGLTVVNGYDIPYHFPHSMTLFQTSEPTFFDLVAEQDGSDFDKGESVVKVVEEFKEWFKTHNRKTVVSLDDGVYGGNVSTLKFLDNGSYELVLATYSPTDIVDGGGNWNHLDTDTFLDMRDADDGSYQDGKYVFDNHKEGDVGFVFNMYDTFITGKDRVMKIDVPRNNEFNKLQLKFRCKMLNKLSGPIEAVVEVDGRTVFNYNSEDEVPQIEEDVVYPILNTTISETEARIAVRIHHQVDFGKRNTEQDYRERLKGSGVVLENIRLETGVETSESRDLTFGSYVNEVGISDQERERRYWQFWTVSQYKRDVTYQTVLETSLKNVMSNGIGYRNNYSSGDLYGDMFVTKSVLDPRYDMNMSKDGDALQSIGRDYIGIGSCSNQLSLVYKPTDVRIAIDKMDDITTTKLEESELKYQLVEVVKNINRFESSIKHKSNVFSVVVENSNLAKDTSEDADPTLEKYKEQLRNSVTQFVRNTCEGIVPVHTQLFDVQFT